MYEKSDNILEIMILKAMYERIKNSQDFQYLTHVETKTSGTDSSFTGHKDWLWWKEISSHVFGVKIYASRD